MRVISAPMLLALLLAVAVQQSPVATVAMCVGEPQPRPAVDGAQLMRDVRALAADSMEGREIGSRGGERAQRYLLHRIRGLGLDSLGSMVKPFDAGRQGDAVVKGANVVALVKGTVDPANHLVVTAHYDHEGVRRGEIYNGADDNASGSATLLELAAALAARPERPRRTLAFHWYGAEESGLLGSAHYVAHPLRPLEDTVFMLNLDMVGRLRGGTLMVGATGSSPLFPLLLPGLCLRAGLVMKEEPRVSSNSAICSSSCDVVPWSSKPPVR